jgi:hypothetical protein
MTYVDAEELLADVRRKKERAEESGEGGARLKLGERTGSRRSSNYLTDGLGARGPLPIRTAARSPEAGVAVIAAEEAAPTAAGWVPVQRHRGALLDAPGPLRGGVLRPSRSGPD